MATSVTRFKTFFFGRFVGKDSLGNRYYTHKHAQEQRWVVFAKNKDCDAEDDASLVPAEWHPWLHHTCDDPPNKSDKLRVRRRWQKPHRPNMTGQASAYFPAQTDPQINPREGDTRTRKKQTRDEARYESWTPQAK